MKLADLIQERDSGASDSNYYSNETREDYKTWQDFYNEYHDADIGMNLIYRWDVFEKTPESYGLNIFMIMQRKGIYKPIGIKNIEEKDVYQIKKMLKRHFYYLVNMWNPLNIYDSKEGTESGEICNREGCTGIIVERDNDRNCSCHIFAPCSSCCHNYEICPECGWTQEQP
jgi:hypothetical protein